MQDLIGMLQSLRRPGLLIRAARAGLPEYRRTLHLQRLLGPGTPPRPGAALMRLMELEAEQDEKRRADHASYSIARHVELLAAMMAEAELVRCAQG